MLVNNIMLLHKYIKVEQAIKNITQVRLAKRSLVNLQKIYAMELST